MYYYNAMALHRPVFSFVGKPKEDGAVDPGEREKRWLKWVKYQAETAQAVQVLFSHATEQSSVGLGPLFAKAKEMLREAGVKVVSPAWFASQLRW